jgi:hypothetical protein
LQAVSGREVRRKLGKVRRRLRRLFVTLQADVPDPRARQQLEHGVEHAETGAQDGHHDDIGAEHTPVRRLERRRDD